MNASAARAAALALIVASSSMGIGGQQPPQHQPDFERLLQQQVETDTTWRTASERVMQLDKITYRSKVGDMDIPAFVFQPLKLRGAKAHPALVRWIRRASASSAGATAA